MCAQIGGRPAQSALSFTPLNVQQVHVCAYTRAMWTPSPAYSEFRKIEARVHPVLLPLPPCPLCLCPSPFSSWPSLCSCDLPVSPHICYRVTVPCAQSCPAMTLGPVPRQRFGSLGCWFPFIVCGSEKPPSSPSGASSHPFSPSDTPAWVTQRGSCSSVEGKPGRADRGRWGLGRGAAHRVVPSRLGAL